MYSIDERFQEIIKQCQEQKESLLKELNDLKEEDELENVQKSEKITNLEAQISDYRMRIRKQQQQLSRPFPKFDDSLSNQLELVRSDYIKIARERQQMVNYTQLDEYENKYLKDLNKLEYIKKAYFQLLGDKQSTLLNFSGALDNEFIRSCQVEEDSKHEAEILLLKSQISILEDEVSELEGVLEESKRPF